MKPLTVLSAAATTVRSKHIGTPTEQERADLVTLVRTARAAARAIQHTQVLLQTDTGCHGPRWMEESIWATFGTALTAIARIRRWFFLAAMESRAGRVRAAFRPSSTADVMDELHDQRTGETHTSRPAAPAGAGERPAHQSNSKASIPCYECGRALHASVQHQ
jgi:hypothetical protein